MANEQPEFWSTVADRYDRVVDLQIGGEARTRVRERVAREGDLGRLVEFGCGTGFYTGELARKATTLLATDVAPGMLELAKQRVKAENVTFQVEDCQHSSLSDGAFDSAFLSLVLHFTEPDQTLAEMHRVLRLGGTLIIANLDPLALKSLDRIRCLIRILYHGMVGYRIRPPKGLGRKVMAEEQLRNLLSRTKFRVDSAETITDPSRSSNIPIQYFRAVKV
jgi:ubiquinone/menaquinone biosynthesis C-methylase UbiE